LSLFAFNPKDTPTFTLALVKANRFDFCLRL
jgi:hypothetical protein